MRTASKSASPKTIALTWSTSDQVGISAVEIHPGGRETMVLIEKELPLYQTSAGRGDEVAFLHPTDLRERQDLRGPIKMAKIEA